MSPMELEKMARQAMARRTVVGTTPLLYLTITAPKNPGRYVRLLGRAGPLGELCTVTDDGRCVALFKPAAILRFLERQGLANQPVKGKR